MNIVIKVLNTKVTPFAFDIIDKSVKVADLVF